MDDSENVARVGAAVLREIHTGGPDSGTPAALRSYAQSLRNDGSLFGAAILDAIANAIDAGPRLVTCMTCGRPKAPLGRDFVGDYCHPTHCNGYDAAPHPGTLWPGEGDA
jgi:hypothetical protein